MKLLNFKIKNNFLKFIFIFSSISIIIIFIIINFNKNKSKIIFSDFLYKISKGEILSINIRSNNIKGYYVNGKCFSTLAPNIYPQLIDDLRYHNVKISIFSSNSFLSSFFSFILYLMPTLLLIIAWIYLMRNMQGGGKILGFGKSKARIVHNNSKKVIFSDVAGVNEAKDELNEIVEFLKNPMKFNKLGGKIPKGCLLIGAPGTGKTLLAKAVAGESGVPFFNISGSDFVEMFVGIGASRVRDMFNKAKKYIPCIIFIDEIDAVGRHRGVGLGGGNDEREQTLNQLLVEMDGFSENQGIIVIAATNRPDVIDKALLRPGRFDRKILIPLPDINGRAEIIKVHIKNIPIDNSINIYNLARSTSGFSGADLSNLINESALNAAKKNKNFVTMEELETAKDKIIMGSEKKSMIMTEKQKKITAYHEAGHALITIFTRHNYPIHKVTIIPTNKALGYVSRLPKEEQYHITKNQSFNDIIISMGGRVAEEIIFGKKNITNGSSSDILQATNIAKEMITKWGFSETIGFRCIGKNINNLYNSNKTDDNNIISEELLKKIDFEINHFLNYAYSEARKIIVNHIEYLHILANNLIYFETLSGEEINKIIIKKKDEIKKKKNL